LHKKYLKLKPEIEFFFSSSCLLPFSKRAAQSVSGTIIYTPRSVADLTIRLAPQFK